MSNVITIRLGREDNTAVYYSYDAANRLLSETWRQRSNSAQVYAFSYDYDAVGNRLTQNDSAEGEMTLGATPPLMRPIE